MKSGSFFRTGDCADAAYANIRDGSDDFATEGRAFTEALWDQFVGLEDKHFLSDAPAHFQSRFWEMYLAVAFKERGFSISPGGDSGPDFWCHETNASFWLEAVTPDAGRGADAVPERAYGVASDVPLRQILLRITNSVAQKKSQYEMALRKKIVTADQPFVLAINSRIAADLRPGNTLPFFVQALLPIGDLTVVLDPGSGLIKSSFYANRESLPKNSGANVSTAVLLNPDYNFVSAVLHSMVDCVNRPARLGDDFQILHNPLAACPLEPRLFAWCEQYNYRDNSIIRTTG